jgi:hypothetical protein
MAPTLASPERDVPRSHEPRRSATPRSYERDVPRSLGTQT